MSKYIRELGIADVMGLLLVCDLVLEYVELYMYINLECWHPSLKSAWPHTTIWYMYFREITDKVRLYSSVIYSYVVSSTTYK